MLTDTAPAQTRKIANELIKPSAISLWTALSDAGLTTQAPRAVQSVTSKRSATIESDALPVFSYAHVPTTLFFGSSPDGDGIFRMTPEKALLDVLYVQGGIDWGSIDDKRIDRSLLHRIAAFFPDRVQRILASSPLAQ